MILIPKFTHCLMLLSLMCSSAQVIRGRSSYEQLWKCPQLYVVRYMLYVIVIYFRSRFKLKDQFLLVISAAFQHFVRHLHETLISWLVDANRPIGQTEKVIMSLCDNVLMSSACIGMIL